MVSGPIGIQRTAPLVTCPIKSGVIKKRTEKIYKCFAKSESISKSICEKTTNIVTARATYKKEAGKREGARERRVRTPKTTKNIEAPTRI